MTKTLKMSALALLGVMVLWACGGNLGPKETGEKFLKAMKSGDFETAKDYATKEAQASLEMMAGMAGAGGDNKGNPDDIKVGDVKEDGDNATLAYTDGGKAMTLDLVKEDGKWKAKWEKGGPGDNTDNPVNNLKDGLEDAFDGAMEELGDELGGEGDGEESHEGHDH